MLLRNAPDVYFHYAQGRPLVIDRPLPVDELSAHLALISTSLTVDCRSWDVIFLGVFAHRAICGKHGLNRAMLSRVRATQAVGIPFFVAGIKLRDRFCFSRS